MVLLEHELVAGESIDNLRERRRKKLREQAALEAGGNYVATALQRFTVRALKFVR